jgi:hypothetical protein
MSVLGRFLVAFGDNVLTGCLAVLALAVAVPATFGALFVL